MIESTKSKFTDYLAKAFEQDQNTTIKTVRIAGDHHQSFPFVDLVTKLDLRSFGTANNLMKNYGKCHLCGVETNLTYEHVPPRAAFNNRPVVLARIEEILSTANIGDLDNPKGKTNQKGSGAYTLCAQCNNNTGTWYGKDFVDWTHQALILSDHDRKSTVLYRTFKIFPLRVIKEILCMFFSANGEKFQEHHTDLVRFVLNREQRCFDSEVKIYTFLNFSNRLRQTGIAGTLGLDEDKKIFSEIAFFPLGYVMTINSLPPDPRLVEITFYSNFHYNDQVDIAHHLPILPVFTAFPGDYRDRDDISLNLSQKPL